MRNILLLAALTYILAIGFVAIMAIDFNNAGGTLSSYQATQTQSADYLVYVILSIGVVALIFSLNLKLKMDWIKYIVLLAIGLITTYAFFFLFLMTILFLTKLVVISYLEVAVLIILALVLTAYFMLRGNKYLNYVAIVLAVEMSAAMAISFSPFFLLIIFAIFSVWDYIAVMKLKSMQKIAKGAITGVFNRALPLFIYEGNHEALKEKISDKGEVKTSNVSILGLGDLIIPGAFIASVFLNYSVALALLLIPTAIYGIYRDMLWAKKIKSAIPALPIMFIFMAFISAIFYLYAM